MPHDDTPDLTPARLLAWTLRKDDRVAICHAQPHVLGVEIVCEVGQEIQRTEVGRNAHAGQALADAWRDAFIGKGWTNVPLGH